MNVKNGKQLKVMFESALDLLNFLDEIKSLEATKSSLTSSIVDLTVQKEKAVEAMEKAAAAKVAVEQEIMELHKHKNEVIGQTRKDVEELWAKGQEDRKALETRMEAIRKEANRVISDREKAHREFMKGAEEKKADMESKLKSLTDQLKKWKDSV